MRRFIKEIDLCDYGGGSKGLRIRGPGVQRSKNQDSWCPRAGEDGYPSSRREKRICSSSTFLFHSGPQWTEWCPHTGESRSSSLGLPNEMLISSRNAFTHTHTPRNNVLLAISSNFSPVKSCKINHHRHLIVTTRWIAFYTTATLY